MQQCSCGEEACCGAAAKREELSRRALWLSYFTVAYNIMEGVVSIVAGFMTGSIALEGFGFDSFIESVSGLVMIWRFRKGGRISAEEEERVERIAVRLVGWSFLLLAAYVAFESVRKLVTAAKPEASLLGIIIALVSLVIMPVLFYLKYRTGRDVGSRSLVADSKQTLACVLLSVALLVGVGLNYLFGWWQADPIAALVIVVFLAREGVKTLRQGELCEC
jgi:cation diffusion facilitator family transporter